MDNSTNYDRPRPGDLDALADDTAERIESYLAHHWPAIPNLERLALAAGLAIELVTHQAATLDPTAAYRRCRVDGCDEIPEAAWDWCDAHLAAHERAAQTGPTVACARALSALVDDARAMIPEAVAARRRHVAHRLAVVVAQLDAARTRLVQDGVDYLECGWAWVDAGRQAVANYRLILPGKREQ
jgi:hypothetical protein